MQGQLIIIAGPSGSGKDTLLKQLLGKYPELLFSISTITRKMRVGEVEGEKYNFVSVEKFQSMIKNNELLEYNLYCQNYYGTPKAPVDKAIEEGKDIVLELDVNGAANVRKMYPDCVTIFIMPPSYDALRERLSRRGTETEEVINERLATAIEEIKRAKEFDYMVINDNVDEAVKDFADIIFTDRKKTARNKKFLDEVLKNVKSVDR